MKFRKRRRIHIEETGSSVIDYIIKNDSNRKGKTGGRRKQNGVGSYTIESRGIDRTIKKSDKKSLVKIERSDWTEERVKSCQENCREWPCIQIKTEGIWNEIREKKRSQNVERRSYLGV